MKRSRSQIFSVWFCRIGISYGIVREKGCGGMKFTELYDKMARAAWEGKAEQEREKLLSQGRIPIS